MIYSTRPSPICIYIYLYLEFLISEARNSVGGATVWGPKRIRNYRRPWGRVGEVGLLHGREDIAKTGMNCDEN